MHLLLSGLSHDGNYASGSVFFQDALSAATWHNTKSMGMPVRWNVMTGEVEFLSIGPVEDASSSISADGKTMLFSPSAPDALSCKNVLWREGAGAMDLKSYIAELELTIPDISLDLAGMSRDGKCVVATSTEKNLWLVCSGTDNPFKKDE